MLVDWLMYWLLSQAYPIPTLDEFVLLHKALQAAVQRQPEMLGLLQGARRSFGWNVLGEPFNSWFCCCMRCSTRC